MPFLSALHTSHGTWKVFPSLIITSSFSHMKNSCLRPSQGRSPLHIAPPSALVLALPMISSFSGPDLDKLVVSFLRALWRAEYCTLESLKTCHFHLELVADLTRQPGKWISVLKQRQNMSSDPALRSSYGNCQAVVKVPFFPTPLIMLKTMSYCFWKS